MPLFTDGPISTIEDLLGYESAILEVARTEKIDLATKLDLAQQEIGIELSAFLVQREAAEAGSLSLTQLELKNIVVTEPLYKWHTFHTLALAYRDAYNSQLNDRYSGKWREYDRLAQWASRMLFQIGVGIVSDPIPQAEKLELSSVPGPLPGATYYLKVSWVDLNNAEGNPSEAGVLPVPDGALLRARAVNPPANARGWNVYVGLSVAELMLQNDSPIPLDQLWTEAESGLKSGRKPGSGQDPEYYLTASRVLPRG